MFLYEVLVYHLPKNITRVSAFTKIKMILGRFVLMVLLIHYIFVPICIDFFIGLSYDFFRWLHKNRFLMPACVPHNDEG